MREEETVWQKLYNTNRKTVLVWKQRKAGGRLRLGEGAQNGSPTGQQAGQAGGRCCGPSSSLPLPPPPPPTLQLCWAASHLLLFPVRPPCTSSSQVELLGSDMLQLLPQHAEGGPHHGVQGPALLHQVVHHGRAAVWGVHLVPLLYPGHHLFQRLTGRETQSVSIKMGRFSLQEATQHSADAAQVKVILLNNK